MSTLLIVDDDAGILAVLEACFESRGHRVICLDDPRHTLRIAEQASVEAVILDLNMPVMNGWVVLDALRKNPKTSRLPIAILSSSAEAPVRVRGLRRGADDFIAKPFDPAELISRVERLVDHRRTGFADLLGRLDENPCREVLQNLEQHGKSGALEIRTPVGGGRAELFEGRLVGASFGAHLGVEALLSMLELDRGSFHFVSGASEAQMPEPLELGPLLLFSAWLDDELQQRQHFLPGPLDELQGTGSSPAMSDWLSDVPIGEVLTRLADSRSSSLVELLSEQLACPTKVRLAVAWLIEHGAIEVASSLPPRAGESEATLEDLDVALRDLFQEAVFRDYPLGSLEISILAEERGWGMLAEFLERLPNAWLDDRGRSLKTKALEKRCGRVVLTHEAGDLTFRLATLNGRRPRLDADCIGAVLCLGGDRAHSGALIEAVESAASASTALVVTAGAETLARLGKGRRWARLEWASASLVSLLNALIRSEIEVPSGIEGGSEPLPLSSPAMRGSVQAAL